MVKGICTEVYLVDGKGDRQTTAATRATPGATSLHFCIDNTASAPPQEQLDLKRAIELVVQAIDTRYLGEDRRATSERFGEYLHRLQRISHLGLVGGNAHPAVANHALVDVIASLADGDAMADNGGRRRPLAMLASFLAGAFGGMRGHSLAAVLGNRATRRFKRP